MRHKTNSSSCMEIWNSKSGGNMYSNFEAKFGVISKVHFSQPIYRFKALEIKKSNASNSMQIGAKTRKLCALKVNWLEKNIEFKIHCAFQTQSLDFELGFLIPLMSSKLTLDLPKF